MKKLILTVITVCVAVALLFSSAGCAPKPAPPPAPSPAPPPAPSPTPLTPYVFGATLELTGRAASIGIPEERVIRMKTEEINAAGGVNGRQLELIIYNNESDAAKAVRDTKRIISVDKAVVCMGYTSSGVCLACIDTATEAKTVLFCFASSEKIWRPTKEWVFNTTPCMKDASTPILVDNLLQRGCTKIAYIYNDSAYGQTGMETFEWTCEQKGLTSAIIEKYAPDAIDVSPQITHIKASGADGLIICGYVADTALVLKTARDLGIEYPIVSEYAVVGPEFIELAGDYAEGVVSTSLKTLVAHDLPDTDIQKTVCIDLYDKYTKEYGPFSLYAGHAWDLMNLITKALEKIDPNLDPTKDEDLVKIRAQLRDNLERLQGVVGQNGVYNYSPDHHNGLSAGCYVPVVVENGEWRLYEAID